MPDGLTPDQRNTLFDRLRYDAAFRGLMKENWRTALRQVGIEPKFVAGGIIKREELEEFAHQAQGWSIHIVIFRQAETAERVEVGEALVFQRKAEPDS